MVLPIKKVALVIHVPKSLRVDLAKSPPDRRVVNSLVFLGVAQSQWFSGIASGVFLNAYWG